MNYDAVVAEILKNELQEAVPVYHDTAPETYDKYPFVVYTTLSVMPSHADNRAYGYVHTVRITIVNRNGSAKALERRIIDAMERAGYVWSVLRPTVESREYGEKYTAIEFQDLYLMD